MVWHRSVNSLDARATEVISTAAADVRFFENEAETHGHSRCLGGGWRFDEGEIEANLIPIDILTDCAHAHLVTLVTVGVAH